MATSINSKSNSNPNSAGNKADNGFAIVASNYQGANSSVYTNYYALSFDAVTNTRVSSRADVSSYAIETQSSTSNSKTNNSMVSDHVQIRNKNFTLEGVISETPIRRFGDLLYAQPLGSRVAAAIDALESIMNARQPISLFTEHKSFSNVILTGVDYDYSAEDAMKFTLNFEQVRLVTGATVNAIATKTQSTVSTGKSTKTIAKPATPAKSSIGNSSVE